MKKNLKVGLLAGLAAFTVGLAGCAENSDSAAENYPERNIEIIVGHGAGGGTDRFARAVASGIEKELDTNVAVVNQTGGAGVVAKGAVANAPSDGYTLSAISAFPVTTAAGTNPHGLDTLQPLARFQHDTYAIWATPERFSSIEEFIEEAESNPGSINVGGTYSLGMDEITTNLLMEESGLEFNYIPMDGDGEMHAGILGGHIDAMTDEIGPTLALAENNDIHPLVVLSDERLDAYPDVPTSVELGWDVTVANERGIMVRRDTDEEIKAILEQALENVYNSEEYQDYAETDYLHLREGWLDSENFEERLESNIERYKEVIDNLE